jgi:hypothetical protein
MKFLRRIFGQSEENHSASESSIDPKDLSESELLFLMRFISCQSLSNLTSANFALERWTAALGKPPLVVVRELERTGMVVRPTAVQRLEGDLTLAQLKDLCRSRNLKVSGKKSELVARLAETDLSDIDRLVPLGDSYICSDAGRELAVAYKQRKKAEKIDTQERSADLLDARDIKGAVKLVCDYEARQVFQRGMGVNWTSGTEGLPVVKSIYSARKAFLRAVSPGDLANIRLVAALDYLWGEEVAIIPDRDRPVSGCRFSLGIAARQLKFHHDHGPESNNLEKMPDYYEAEYLAPHDGECPACQARNGKKYSLNELPELPSEDCTCPFERGCRCTFGYVADEEKLNDPL